MTGTALKFFALILMTIDHIGVFIPEMPVLLRWLGRLSAPIFFFCAAEGICHTRDKKAYLKRLYKFSVLMVLLCVMLPEIVGGGSIHNNIFSSILQGTLVVCILEETKSDSRRRFKYLLGYVAYQAVTIILYVLWNSFLPVINLPVLHSADRIVFTALGSVAMIEGNLILTGMIALFYLCRESKKRLAAGYTIYCLAYFLIFVPQLPLKAIIFLANAGAPSVVINILRVICSLAGFEIIFSSGSFVNSMFFVNYQWFMIFALPFILAYNGKRGEGVKNLFYAYYPLHIAVFYLMGTMLA